MSRGLDRSGRLADERRREAAREAAEPLRLNPEYPWRSVEFDPSYFEIPANPEPQQSDP